MFNKFYIKILHYIINFIDRGNKKKIINFFKKELNDKSLTVIDVGAHTGETIELLFNNFNITKIFAFEANPKIFQKLKLEVKKKKYFNKINLFNVGLGDKEEVKDLMIFNDTSSSTYNVIDEQTKYYKRKQKILSIFGSKNILNERISTKITTLNTFHSIKDIKDIDILKIDTEGYELNILKGIKPDDFKNIKYIYFEHHYDLMIKKNYKYSDIKKLLNKYNFYLLFKVRMNFRKTFEYIYGYKKK